MSGLVMKYFVLKPKGEDVYAKASRIAMFAYSKAIMADNPELSKELWEWASTELSMTKEGKSVGEILNAHIPSR